MHRFIEDISKRLYDDMETIIRNRECCHSVVTYDTKDGFVDVTIDKDDCVDVFVFHNDERQHDDRNIIDAICESVPTWYDVRKDVIDKYNDDRV